MQRLAGDFLVNRVAVVYGQGGASMELYELPNGQWQFGKGRDAVVVTSIEQVAGCDDPNVKRDVEAWLERTKGQTRQAVQQGHTPLLAGESVKDRLGRAIAMMSDEVAARMLNAVEQVLGPVADSIMQRAEVNHHSDGYGQDQHMAAPGNVEPAPFVLPEGARWVDPTNQAAGYLQPIPGVLDDHNVPVVAWHPTPAFHQVTERPDPIPVAETTPLQVHVPKDDVADEMERERRSRGAEDLVGAGRRSTRRR